MPRPTRGARAPRELSKASRGLAALAQASRHARGRGIAALGLGWAAGALLVAGEFLTLYSVRVAGAGCEELAGPEFADACVKSGGEQHAYALVLVGALVLVMAFGAGVGASRPAAVALLACGAAVLVLALARDVPASSRAGPGLGPYYEEARAERGPALWLELAGGGLALAAGALRLAPARR